MSSRRKEYVEEYSLSRRVYEDGEIVSDIDHNFTAEDLDTILENITYFLMGCSFTYLKGLKAEK